MNCNFFITFLILSQSFVFSQIKIKLVNIDNNIPIPNAQIFENKKLLGETDSMGVAILDKNTYEITIKASQFKTKTEIIGSLDKKIFLFSSDVKKESDTKALSILQKMWENRKINNPDNLNNYEFNSYVKLKLDIPYDSISYIKRPKTKLDSLNNNFKDLLKKSYLFLGERGMIHKYDKKYGHKNIVTAYKAGGLDNPEFFNIAISQSLANKYPELLTPREIKHSISKLIDSIEINGRKTYEIYTYSKGKSETHFYKSLTVFVDAESFALVRLIGNTSKVSNIYYEITYTPFQNVWVINTEYMKLKFLGSNFVKKLNKLLPKQLKSLTIFSTNATVSSYFSNYTSPIQFSKKDFEGYEYELGKNVSQQADSTLKYIRNSPLSDKDLSTYKELDHLSKKYGVEPKIRFLKSLSSGKLPIGFFDFDVYSLLSHNLYESFRYQIGGNTNYLFNEKIKLGGYLAKASLDSEVKAGFSASFLINKKQGGEFTFRAESDVLPAGRTKIKYLTSKDELAAKTNNIYNDTYFSYRKLELSYQQDFMKNIDVTFSVDYQRQKADFDYIFKDYSSDTWFNYINTAIKLRYAPNVKYIDSPTGKNSLQDTPPYYYLTYAKSWNLFEKSTSTHKLFLSAIYSFQSNIGTTNVIGNMGFIFGDTPIMNTYEGNGVAKSGKSLWGRFSVRGFQSFETMEPSRFFSDKYISIQLTHYPRPLRISEFKSLHFALIYKGLLGSMSHLNDHLLFKFEDPRNYYQEVGVEINKFILGIVGVGVYARLGAYQISNFDKNMYIKLTLDL